MMTMLDWHLKSSLKIYRWRQKNEIDFDLFSLTPAQISISLDIVKKWMSSPKILVIIFGEGLSSYFIANKAVMTWMLRQCNST